MISLCGSQLVVYECLFLRWPSCTLVWPYWTLGLWDSRVLCPSSCYSPIDPPFRKLHHQASLPIFRHILGKPDFVENHFRRLVGVRCSSTFSCSSSALVPSAPGTLPFFIPLVVFLISWIGGGFYIDSGSGRLTILLQSLQVVFYFNGMFPLLYPPPNVFSIVYNV